MAPKTPKDDQEEPLDPAVEAIRVKMVRLLMVSGGIMGLGLMAVLAAIVYKVSSEDEANVAQQPVSQEFTGQVRSGYVGAPKGSTILSAVPDGAGLMITLRKADGSVSIQRHNGAGQLIATYGVIEE